VGGGAAGVWWAQQRAAAEREAEVALDGADRLRRDGKVPEALLAAQRAQPLLAAGLLSAPLARRVEERLADLNMLARLEEVRLLQTAVKDGDFDTGAADPAYRRAFKDSGIDVLTLGPQEAAQRIQDRSIRVELVAALAHWSTKRRERDSIRRRLRAVVRAAEPDGWWARVFGAMDRQDVAALKNMAAPDQTAGVAPSSLVVLAESLRKSGAGEQEVALLRRAQQAHPNDFWINLYLAQSYSRQTPPEWGEAIRYHSIAVALRPHSPGARLNLGHALAQKGGLDEAIAEYRQAIRLKKDYAEAHDNLGLALEDQGRLDEAIAAFREAIRLKQDLAEAHSNLGALLCDKKKDYDEAIAAFREAIRLKQDLAEAHHNLGVALYHKGRLDEAIAAYREALRLKKDYPEAHLNLGVALAHKGRLDKAIAEFREAIRLKKDSPEAHFNLGSLLGRKGRLEEAIVAYREAIRLKTDYPEAYSNLGNALRAKGRLDEAIAACQEAIRLKPDYAAAHCNLSDCLMRKGQFAQALAALRRGHEIGSRRADWRYPSARWVRQAEQMVALDRKLSAILNGKARPADVAEELGLAWLCQQPYKRLYAASANFYAAAFKAQPRLAEDLQAGHRDNAACAAALAGCGQGKDADQSDDRERGRLRRQAVDWLRADLAAYRRLLEKAPDRAGPAIRERLRHWQQDTNFAGIREAEALAKLPEAERAAWQKLWADVAGLLTQARGKATAEAKPKDRSDQ
jgi:tetratricopeptide (TPR) repeat protein